LLIIGEWESAALFYGVLSGVEARLPIGVQKLIDHRAESMLRDARLTLGTEIFDQAVARGSSLARGEILHRRHSGTRPDHRSAPGIRRDRCPTITLTLRTTPLTGRPAKALGPRDSRSIQVTQPTA
jgi:hypothetical protein